MQHVSLSLQLAFGLISLATVYWFYVASNKSKIFLLIAFLWMSFQMILGLTEFYLDGLSLPPRFLLLLLPPILLAIAMFTTKKGKIFIETLYLKQLTLIQTIRAGLEIILFDLYLAKAVPEIMTFEGRNFDIISGLTAPVVYYYGFIKKSMNRTAMITWNVISLALALNIVFTAILSAQTPFQQFGFEQPNIAVAYFPFNWLPSVVVPILLFSQLVSIRQLLIGKKEGFAKSSIRQ